jgi:hypothetical protein
MTRQLFLPGFPEGADKVGESLSILTKDGQVVYFLGGDNYFSHPVGDEKCRRFVMTSLMANGHVRACDLEKPPLSIPHRTLMNWIRQSREKGPASFFQPAKIAKPRVMTPESVAECARLLGEGKRLPEVSMQVGINESTLRKAQIRNVLPKRAEVPAGESAMESTNIPASTKSERSREDAEAADGMGTACTRADERIAAAMGVVECAATRFEQSHDVPMAGLLTGLPALCANGLFNGIGGYLKLPNGFYSVLHILLTLGFMALGRIRRPEGLRHVPPGEFGKLIGLDRVPEVRTLREKVGMMAKTGNPGGWMKELAKTWMDDNPDEAGYLYVDGHVRVYNGSLANLPRRYVSRQKLCLRGTTDYWVNDAIGQPFFVISKAITEGMEEVLLKDIVPELLKSVPNQPTEEALENDPLLHRFVIVCDREVSNYSLASKLWNPHRIGLLTYRKNVKDKWPESDFMEYDVPVPGGGKTQLKLALRQTQLSSGAASMPVTEVRCLTQTGHQTAIITTARHLGNTTIAGRMFARWCQENFFAYMMEHYDIDGLIEYGTENIPGTTLIVNPDWRDLDKEVKKNYQNEKKLQAKLAKHTMKDGEEIQKKAELVEAIQAVQVELARLRAERRKTSRKVTLDSLPVEQRPTQLLPLNKMLTDSVKMIAYRAETAMVTLLRRHMKKEDEARALIRELFVSSGDIEPDDAANTLTIRIHRMANPVNDRAVSALLEELTKQEFCHPESGAKMIYTLV